MDQILYRSPDTVKNVVNDVTRWRLINCGETQKIWSGLERTMRQPRITEIKGLLFASHLAKTEKIIIIKNVTPCH